MAAKDSLRKKKHQIRVIINGADNSGRELVQGAAEYVHSLTDWRLLTVFEPYNASNLDLTEDDGLILGILGGFTPDIVHRLDPHRQAVIGCNAIHERWGIPYVGVDNNMVGRIVAEHFIQNGFERCVFDSFKDNGPDAVQRWTAFRNALEEAGVEAHTVDEDFRLATAMDRPEDFSDLIRLLLEMPKPVGLFISFDAIAFTAVEQILSAGLDIPEEIAMVGVDNDQVRCEITTPKLSSVDTQMRRVGYEAAKALDQTLRGEPPQLPITIPPAGIVVRQSSDIIAIDDPKLATALRFIREHACDPCSVDDVLDHVQCSRRWLELRCTKLLRRTPHQQIVQVRMKRARWLLKTTDLPLGLIAMRCGYDLQQNFRRAFHRQEGCSPSNFRQRHTEATLPSVTPLRNVRPSPRPRR